MIFSLILLFLKINFLTHINFTLKNDLWRQVGALRKKHDKQQDTVQRLITFMIHFIQQAHDKVTFAKRVGVTSHRGLSVSLKHFLPKYFHYVQYCRQIQAYKIIVEMSLFLMESYLIINFFT